MRSAMNKQNIFTLGLSWIALLLWLPSVASGDAEGEALAHKVYNRPDGKDMSSSSFMILQGKRSQPRKRTLHTYRLDKDDGETLSLIRFTQPVDIDGTGLLTRNPPGEESNQWVYLPELDRARRISSSRQGGRFVGSDLYYEDLRKRDVDKDRHRIIGKDKVGGAQTTLLESIPVDPDNSTYSKRISWIHTGTLIPLRVDYYKDGRDTPVKRMKASKIKKIQGYWTVLESTVQDLHSGHQTRLVTKVVKYDQDLPDKLFSRQALSDPQMEKAYRP